MSVGHASSLWPAAEAIVGGSTGASVGLGGSPSSLAIPFPDVALADVNTRKKKAVAFYTPRGLRDLVDYVAPN